MATGSDTGGTSGAEIGDPETTAAAAGAAGLQGPLSRNLLVISLDTLRGDRLPFLGYDRDTAPHLAGVARRGLVFESARAQASQTAPSHASLFTSTYPGEHRIVNVHDTSEHIPRLPPGATTLAEHLQAGGFETGAFVSGGNLTRRMDMDRGFDVWDEALEDVGERVRACVRWMLAPERGRFFAFLHTYQTHAPYLPPAEWIERFTDPEYRGQLRARHAEYLSLPVQEAWAAATGPRYWEGMLEYDEDDVAFLSDLYDAEIAYLDQELRVLFEFLWGGDGALGRDTTVVILSDHGEEFRDHGKFQHDQVFDELLRVPLVIRLPPRWERQGWVGRFDEPLGLVDVAPTLSEIVGLDWSATGWAGRSLLPLVSPGGDGRRWEPRPVFSELVVDPGPKYARSVVWQGWKYIHTWQSDKGHVWEWLFHLTEDPGERRNLLESEDPVARQALGRLRRLLDEHTGRTMERAQELGQGEPAPMDADMVELMRQLGYTK